MISFISQQPNGLYCRFSKEVGTLTHYNMTREDYLNNVTGTVANRTDGEVVLKHHLKPFNWVLEQFEEIDMCRAEFNILIGKLEKQKNLVSTNDNKQALKDFFADFEEINMRHSEFNILIGKLEEQEDLASTNDNKQVLKEFFVDKEVHVDGLKERPTIWVAVNFHELESFIALLDSTDLTELEHMAVIRDGYLAIILNSLFEADSWGYNHFKDLLYEDDKNRYKDKLIEMFGVGEL